MSFITKRERVFNDYDLYDLPARNEGKLKAYASCTDARAWSHFCSDKSEHLVEVIKRNNEAVRPKYLPTDVIVDTLMVAKNAEIARLKHKIEEFEQMLAAYDQLDLTYEQKCEIANAHAAIRAANRELDELCLDLDLSGFTELSGIDSEGFATGKSRGDEASPKTVSELEDSRSFLPSPKQQQHTPFQANKQENKQGNKQEYKQINKQENKLGNKQENMQAYKPENMQSYKTENMQGYKPENMQGYKPENMQGYKPENMQGYKPENMQAYKQANKLDNKQAYKQEFKPETRWETKGVQNDELSTSDVAILVKDTRIDEMKGTIITKDAKLNAMRNTIAVMENDVCEPYCIYAHIYTALEKIFGILCQNDKYRQYLKLLTCGKDTRCIDIKGKILFKLKVLEKFCYALIAPCTQSFLNNKNTTRRTEDCACYRVDVGRVEPAFALTTAESKQPSTDNRRAQLVADIIQNDEMKDILSKENCAIKADEDVNDDVLAVDNYSIDAENLKRLKTLQENYDDLMTCYETLKHDKDNLERRCNKYEEMEDELESLKVRLREYNSVWNEKEHYRKRSADLDTLKEQYLILTDETSTLETQLKAESEINHIKCKAMDGLRAENIALEKKLNETAIAFEKEKNVLLCKLNEADCRIMCQGQQIKSMLQQIDRLLEADPEKEHSRQPDARALALMQEIESSKEQIKNLRDALFCNEEEKEDLQKHYQNQLEYINELKLETEDLKSKYEKSLQCSDNLEKHTQSLMQDLDEKTSAVDNLISVIENKSMEINKLIRELENEKDYNRELLKQLNELRNRFDNNLVSLENEKLEALQSLQVARQESQELLEKVKDYNQVVNKKADVTKSLELQLQDNKELQNLLMATVEENRNLKKDLTSHENNNAILLQEIQRLQDVNKSAVESISSLKDETKQYQISLELNQKESGELKDQIIHFENTTLQLRNLQESHERLMREKSQLENELIEKSYELDRAIHDIQLCKRESDELIDRLQQSEGSKDNELFRISEAYQRLSSDKNATHKELVEKKKDVDNLLQTLNSLKLQNEHLLQKCNEMSDLENQLSELKKAYTELSYERNMLQNDFDNKTDEINNLYNTLENKIEENRDLIEQVKSLKINQSDAKIDIRALKEERMTTESRLNMMKKESAELLDKIKYYEALEIEFEKLKRAHADMKVDKENLQTELNIQLSDLRRMERENTELQSHSQNLMSHSEDLGNALINARTELIQKSSVIIEPYKDIKVEIEKLRQEKANNQHKIRGLLDKLDQAENIISSLTEDVMARDDKIATLQNHLNEMEEEVTKLHGNLAELINTGEEMKDFGFQKMNSLKNMEAHHSRATHNMKMELAKLQHENSMLSEQLSVTKVQSEESSRDKFKFMSQIDYLHNEREIIVTDIKQLELKSVGDSALMPNNCDIKEILSSLDRIRKYIDEKINKSSSLERTLLKVQTSSQLLLSKADEAKKIVEREKQKIISEKEDAIIDKQNMEAQLLELKAKLEKQIANDKAIIEDLEATILNQKLIIDKINKSTEDYISKLKEELQNLKEIYQKSVDNICDLQQKLQSVNEDKSKLINMMDEIKADLIKKSNEIVELKTQLEEFNNKSYRNAEIQAKRIDLCRNVASQTDKELLYSSETARSTSDTKTKNADHAESIDIMEMNKPPLDKRREQDKRLGNQLLLNEVQILAAAVEQPFDVVRSSYVNYKMKQLSPGRLELTSIPDITDTGKSEQKAATSTQIVDRRLKKPRKPGKKYSNAKTQSNNLIDIYNRHSMYTNSSKGYDGSENILSGKLATLSQGKSTGYTGTRESDETDSNINGKYKDSKSFVESTSDKSTDKDLFIIYKDSESSYNTNNKRNSKGTWSGKHSEIVVEAVTVHPAKNGISRDRSRPQNYIEKDSHIFHETEENFEDKHMLKINVPRVDTGSPSLITTSDMDKKSLDSYTIALCSSLKPLSDSDTKINEGIDSKSIKRDTPSLPTISNEGNQYLGSYNSLGVGSDEDVVRPGLMKTKAIETDSSTSKQKHSETFRMTLKSGTPFETESHHKLSRVGADVLLLKLNEDQNNPQIALRQNFGLEYIMDTVQGEVNPDIVKYYGAGELRKSRSDERFNLKLREKADTTPTGLSDLKMSSTEYKTFSTNSKSSEKSHPKSYTERSIMAKLDINHDYEYKISSLTKALENIEKDYKKKIEAIKMQYDNNIKSIINEHNQGVKSIQSLHEETLQDIIKLHENEVENLRTMSIEAMRKADKLEKENRALKSKVQDCGTSYCVDEEPIKILSPELKRRKKCRGDGKMLTKTMVEAFNVKPKSRSNGPCTCSLDINISDTIRNIFEQVDVEQRKMAEHTYLKYIANKILNGNVEILDAQELSFLHLKVCRTWKTKLTKEEALQKRIDSLENELMNKQRNAQQHIAELDRKVAEERRRLQEVREAVCRSTPRGSRGCSPASGFHYVPPPEPSTANADKDPCGCNLQISNMEVGSRRSAGDLVADLPTLVGSRTRRTRPESNRAVVARLDVEERREKRLYNDEPPTRLRRSLERQPLRFTKK